MPQVVSEVNQDAHFHQQGSTESEVLEGVKGLCRPTENKKGLDEIQP